MAIAALRSLRDRLNPPPAPRPVEGGARAPGTERALALASLLFGVGAAALVLATPDGLAVSGAAGPSAEAARGIACRLFELLAGADPAARGDGVLEEVTPGGGFIAAAPVMSAGGRCVGAICLLDAARLGLLSAFQRRLLAEIGGLLGARSDATAEARAGVDALRRAADVEADAFALFDRDGRCLLRNGRFDALLGTASAGGASSGGADGARGREAAWIAARLMRDLAPVGVYRAALAEGGWLCVEERRGPHGRSLIARVERGDGFGDPEAQLLFERCPTPMFVFDDGTRSVLAANAAALSLYGWDRDAFLGLDVDAIGPVPRRGEPGEGPAAPGDGGRCWTHRTRDGRVLTVLGRATPLIHRGRSAVLVTVSVAPPALVRAA